MGQLPQFADPVGQVAGPAPGPRRTSGAGRVEGGAQVVEQDGPGRGVHGELMHDQGKPVGARSGRTAVPGEQRPQLEAGAHVEGAAGEVHRRTEAGLVGELPLHQRIRPAGRPVAGPGGEPAVRGEAGAQLRVGGQDGAQGLAQRARVRCGVRFEQHRLITVRPAGCEEGALGGGQRVVGGGRRLGEPVGDAARDEGGGPCLRRPQPQRVVVGAVPQQLVPRHGPLPAVGDEFAQDVVQGGTVERPAQLEVPPARLRGGAGVDEHGDRRVGATVNSHGGRGVRSVAGPGTLLSFLRALNGQAGS
ncbi:hypothetical protein OG828_01295 [Streptomyces sp. NBC_00457]|uniref:hypothetical protein n=1 Tax=Streptomyces sp. NBC_00457 TaxID=2975748 RepID=UPI002E1DA857